MTFCAYIHADADGAPFYVGKGQNGRSRSFRNRSAHYAAFIEQLGSENVLVGELLCSTEAVAFELERGLIKCLKRTGASLLNRTSGGQGSSGVFRSADTRKRMSLAQKGRAGHPQTAETRAKIALALTGVKRSDDFCDKVRARTKGRFVSQETRDKISAANSGKVRPQCAIAASSAKNLGSKRSIETRIKMAEARRAYWARKHEESK